MLLMPFIFSLNKKTNIKKNDEGDSEIHFTPFDSTFLQTNKFDYDQKNDYKFRFFICLLLTIPILILSPTIQGLVNLNLRFSGDTYLLLGLTTFIFIYGGWPFFVRSLNEIKTFSFNTMTLISLAIVIFYVYCVLTVFDIFINDRLWELASVIVILLLFHWIQAYFVTRISNNLDQYTDILPTHTNKLLADGQTTTILTELLQVDDRIVVKTDETIPADGIIIEGVSTVDEMRVIGTSKAIEKQVHDEVFAGDINRGDLLFIKVLKNVDNSYLSKASTIVNSLHEQQSVTQSSARNKAKWLFYLILLVSVGTFIAWFLLDKGIEFALERMITVLLIASPFAVLLTPALILASTAIKALKKGIVIHKRQAFEDTRYLHAITFNEADAFTNKEYVITNIETYHNYEEDEVIFDLASLLAKVNTPFTKGVLKYAHGIEIELENPVTQYRVLPTIGSEGYLDGDKLLICNADYAIQQNLPFNKSLFNVWARDGKDVIFALANDLLIGMLAFNNPLKYDAQEPVHFLKELDFDVNLMTEKGEEPAQQLAQKLNINNVYAGLSMESKVKKIKALQHEENLEIGVVGNGVDDHSLLEAANVSFATNTGTEIVHTADIQLARNEPTNVVQTIEYAIANNNKTTRIFWLLLFYTIIAIALATGILNHFGFLLTPVTAAALMGLSTSLILLISTSSK